MCVIVCRLSVVEYGDSESGDVSLRIITDHIRSTTMLICDGVMPSNEGRGYVLRRLLRRAARHGRLLGIKDAFLCDVCATVIRESGSAYPELVQKQEFIQKVVRMEEENFNRTIDAGLHILDEMIAKTKADGKTELSGKDAFKLNDTFGFPIDLTVEILEEQGLGVDREGYDALMNEQRERARAARAAMGDFAWESVDLGLDKSVKTEFKGYETTECKGEILALVADGELVSAASEGMAVRVVLDQTSFYAESGGQMADFGELSAENGVIEISDVQKTRDGKFLHIGKVKSGAVSVGDAVVAKVDETRRTAIMRAHSATHLLQKALRGVLGTHVEQAGSLVGPDSVRFDFTHFAAMTPEEISTVEREVNATMMAGLPIVTESLPIEEAKKRGAMALFGEKYGNIVRVVQMGDYSIELCGGTHLDNTAKAGLFKIVSESSVAAGVRRIEAICGTSVLEKIEESNRMMYHLADVLKTSPKELANKAAQTANEVKTLRQELAKLQDKLAQSNAQDLLKNAQEIGGLHVITAKFENVKADALRTIGDQLRDADPAVVVVLASVTDGKIVFVASCGKDAVAHGVLAGKLIREVATTAGGSGGGKPDSAMAGGNDVSKLDEALALVSGFVSENTK